LTEETRQIIASTENTPCFEPVSAYYALSAFQYAVIEPGSPTLADLTLLFLVREHRLIPLSKKLRADTGGLWNKKLRSGKDLLLAAYDCPTSAIYYDPYLPLHDLAASIRHEISHLVQDRLLPRHPQLTAKEQILVDETLASVHAGLQQAMAEVFRRDRETDGRIRFPQAGAPDPVSESFAQIDFDFSLYARHGHLQSIIEMLRLEHQTTYQQVYQKIFAESDLTAHFEAILKLVGAVYFPREVFDARKIVRVLRSLPPADFDSYAFDPRGENHYTLKQQWIDQSELYRIWDLGSDASLLVPSARAALRDLFSPKKIPSQQCEEFLERKKDGTLDDYLGHDADIRPGGEGVKPGGEGVKPGTGTKPCLRPPKGF
jgi:hypothetical protein